MYISVMLLFNAAMWMAVTLTSKVTVKDQRQVKDMHYHYIFSRILANGKYQTLLSHWNLVFFIAELYTAEFILTSCGYYGC